MVHKEKKKKKYFLSKSFTAEFLLQGEKKEDACQHFGNDIPFSTSTVLCLFCLDLLSRACCYSSGQCMES